MFGIIPFDGVESLTSVDFGQFDEGDVVLLVTPMETAAQEEEVSA